MAVQQLGGGYMLCKFCRYEWVIWLLFLGLVPQVLAQNNVNLELSSKSLAVTPAAAEAPSDGSGPTIVE